MPTLLLPLLLACSQDQSFQDQDPATDGDVGGTVTYATTPSDAPDPEETDTCHGTEDVLSVFEPGGAVISEEDQGDETTVYVLLPVGGHVDPRLLEDLGGWVQLYTFGYESAVLSTALQDFGSLPVEDGVVRFRFDVTEDFVGAEDGLCVTMRVLPFSGELGLGNSEYCFPGSSYTELSFELEPSGDSLEATLQDIGYYPIESWYDNQLYTTCH